MQRSKFPYTARSSAKVIRHAVSIDERVRKFRSRSPLYGSTFGSCATYLRTLLGVSGPCSLPDFGPQDKVFKQTPAPAPEVVPSIRFSAFDQAMLTLKTAQRAKFRSDLISEAKTSRPNQHHRLHGQRSMGGQDWMTNGSKPSHLSADRFRRRSAVSSTVEVYKVVSPRLGPVEEGCFDPRKRSYGQLLTTSPPDAGNATDAASIKTSTSIDSYQPANYRDDDDDTDEDEAAEQDIEEIWFPGCHADLGGGWPLANGEESALSHGPLVWMVREAQRAGLEFDHDKLLQFKCCDENYSVPSPGIVSDGPSIPKIEVKQPFSSPKSEERESGCRYLLDFFLSCPEAWAVQPF